MPVEYLPSTRSARSSRTSADSHATHLTSKLEDLLDRHRRVGRPRLDRLWRYYRNRLPLDPRSLSDQARGLPRRLIASAHANASEPRERVIENDIAWRIHALVDFMFPRPAGVRSLAEDDGKAAAIDALLRHVFDAAGGAAFFQDLALLGSVYGHVDLLVDIAEGMPRLQLVSPMRGVALPSDDDYRRAGAYLIHHPGPSAKRATLLSRLLPTLQTPSDQPSTTVVFTQREVRRYRSDKPFELGRRVGTEANVLGRVPVVHIQNLSQPYHWAGLSDVEPLIPLQDELNTRLSDRANRVTLQSFKMYLGKGLEGFTDRPVGPGQMWQTDNPDASIAEFGGDAASPSEESHIREIREALDKTSGVTPIAAGLLSGKVGNLTSENALRIVLLGLLTKTQKKRVTYGQGIAQACELILHAADHLGLIETTAAERRVHLDWPDPLPDADDQKLRAAKAKRELGVPIERVLAELGYVDIDLDIDTSAPA